MLGRCPTTVGLPRARLLAGVRTTPKHTVCPWKSRCNFRRLRGKTLTQTWRFAGTVSRPFLPNATAPSAPFHGYPQNGHIPHTRHPHRLLVRDGASEACAPAAHSCETTHRCVNVFISNSAEWKKRSVRNGRRRRR